MGLEKREINFEEDEEVLKVDVVAVVVGGVVAFVVAETSVVAAAG